MDLKTQIAGAFFAGAIAGGATVGGIVSEAGDLAYEDRGEKYLSQAEVDTALAAIGLEGVLGSCISQAAVVDPGTPGEKQAVMVCEVDGRSIWLTEAERTKFEAELGLPDGLSLEEIRAARAEIDPGTKDARIGVARVQYGGMRLAKSASDLPDGAVTVVKVK